jgi:hypothetical protein
MQVSEKHLVQALPLAGTDWMQWLALADRLQLARLVARCAEPVARELLRPAASGREVKQQVIGVGSLNHCSLQLVFEAVLVAGRRVPMRQDTYAYSYVPRTAAWRAPGDLV